MSQCPNFLRVARQFSRSLQAHADKGIALTLPSVKTTYETVHKPDVDLLLPVSSFPISYNEYMQGMMQATNDEVVDFLSFLRDSEMHVVDPAALNRSERFFTRIPPDLTLRGDYEVIRTDASVDTLYNYTGYGYNEAYIGLGAALYDNAHNLRQNYGWQEKMSWSNSLNQPILPWDDFVALQEVKAVRNTVMGVANSVTISNTSPWHSSALVHFIGDNQRVVECFGGARMIPDCLYAEFAETFVKLKDYRSFSFSHEYREQNVIADFAANLRMRTERGDRILMSNEEVKFKDVVTKHQNERTIFRFK